MYDIIIIGAGPAGLTASIYACRANKKVLVLEALTYGGQIINALKVDNYPGMPHVSGVDFATTLYEQAIELGAEVKFEKAIDIDKEKKIVTTTNNKYEAKAIIIATGVKNKKLDIDREEYYVGKGISYCATCDGRFYKNKDVAIAIDNNTKDDILYLSNLVNKLYVIYKRNITNMDDIDNVEYISNSYISKLIGDKKLEGIEVTDKEGNIRNINIDGLFIDIGRIPENNNIVKDIKLNSDGYIEALEDMHTNIDGIFVAGDVREKSLRQLTTAVNDGSIAATEACKYINKP